MGCICTRIGLRTEGTVWQLLPLPPFTCYRIGCSERLDYPFVLEPLYAALIDTLGKNTQAHRPASNTCRRHGNSRTRSCWAWFISIRRYCSWVRIDVTCYQILFSHQFSLQVNGQMTGVNNLGILRICARTYSGPLTGFAGFSYRNFFTESSVVSF